MDSTPAEASLGNLAQVARTNQLKTARGIMYFVGILTIVVNLGFIAFADKLVDSQIDAEITKLRGQNMVVDQDAVRDYRERAIRSLRLVNGVAVLIGVVYVVLGAYVYKIPVPATILGLVLYIGSAAVYGVIDPTTLARGWIIKIVIVVALFKAVQAALAYENERKQTLAEPLSSMA